MEQRLQVCLVCEVSLSVKGVSSGCLARSQTGHWGYHIASPQYINAGWMEEVHGTSIAARTIEMVLPNQGQLWAAAQRVKSNTARQVDIDMLARGATDVALLANVSSDRLVRRTRHDVNRAHD